MFCRRAGFGAFQESCFKRVPDLWCADGGEATQLTPGQNWVTDSLVSGRR